MQTAFLTNNAYLFFIFAGAIFIAISLFVIMPEKQKVQIDDSSRTKRRIVTFLFIVALIVICYLIIKKCI